MSQSTFFEDLDGNDAYPRMRDPIWTLGLDDADQEKYVLKWLVGERNHLQSDAEERLNEVQRHLQLYKGIQYESQETRLSLVDRSNERNKVVKKIVVNHLYDLTENRVSRLVKYKPAVAVLPSNDEFQDEISAKVVKQLLSHIWYNEGFEGKLTPEIVRHMSVMGEAYLFITWDPDKGDKHPDSVDGAKVPLMNDNGEPYKDENGKTIYIERPIKVGDVKYELVRCTDVLLDRADSLSEVNFCFRRKVMPVAEARLRWPDKADQLQPNNGVRVYDFEKMTSKQLDNQVVVWTFTHKHHKGMPNGRQIVFTDDCVLENTEHPYSHGGLPFVRLTDIDLPGELHAHSFYRMVKALTGAYNNITNLVLRNEVLASHPKWMMPAGACRLDQLGNDVTIVQYKGPMAPQLVQSNPTSNSSYKFMEALKAQFEQISGVYGVSRGDPPPGIKAGIALQHLAEQESERHNANVLKFNEFVKDVAKMTISVASDYYDASDDRMIRVLGKNNKWMSVAFDNSHLAKDYDVRIQNSSALPTSKAGRMQQIIDLNDAFPGLVSQEQVLDMIDLGQSDKFVDSTTVSIKAAEAENEMMTMGGKINEPQEYEDHVQHWRIHARAIQEFSFKNQTPHAIQKKKLNHLRAHEMFMVKKAGESPAYAKKLEVLPGFPLLFEAAQIMPVAMPDGGQAPAGAPMSEGLPSEMNLPVNPDLGGEPGLPVNQPPPSVEIQQPGERNIPPNPGPVPPTSSQ